jgi:hypothetical protein
LLIATPDLCAPRLRGVTTEMGIPYAFVQTFRHGNGERADN